MANIIKDLKLSTDLDQIYTNKDLIDIFGDENVEMKEAEELVKKLTDSDEHISSSELLIKIFSDILRRIKNIETLTESQWKDVTLVIDNVDSID